MAAYDGEVGLGDGRLVHELTVEHDDDAVGQLEQLVQILADEENRGAAVPGSHHLRADLRHRREVEPEAGVGGDQHFHVPGQLARQHQALHVAPGEAADRGVGRRCLDVVAADQLAGGPPHGRPVQAPAGDREGRLVEDAEGEVLGHAHPGHAGVAQRLLG